MASLKLSKLTQNYEKSVAFGKRVEQELAAVGEGILQTRLAMAKLQQKMQDTLIQTDRLECSLKKQQEQTSGYDYKMQKLEIRLQEYTRKVQIQQKIYDKKTSHQAQLQARAQELETQLKDQNVVDTEIQNAKQAIKIIDKKLATQADQIEVMCTSQFNLNKITRAKEDEVSRKQKANQKKRALLANLNKQLEGQEEKQNDPLNRVESGEQRKVKTLVRSKQNINKQLLNRIDLTMLIYKQLQILGHNGLQVKKNLARAEEIISDSKVKRSMKLSQMLKFQTEVKEV